jgi:hypothetical protein
MSAVSFAAHIQTLNAFDVSSTVALTDELNALVDSLNESIRISVRTEFEAYLSACYMIAWCFQHLSEDDDKHTISSKLLDAFVDSDNDKL